MSEKFRGKYRIQSSRCPNWDYRSNAAYFITICTYNREHFFGEIMNKKMILSEIGKIAEHFWYEIPEHFQFVKLDAFIAMPNHIHGIIIIDNPDRINNKNANNDGNGDENFDDGFHDDYVDDCDDDCDDDCVETLQCNVSNNNPSINIPPNNIPPINIPPTDSTILSGETGKNKFMSKISPKSGSLSSILRSYKFAVTRDAHIILKDFDWQARFHDHIIRDNKSFKRIQNYILNNPKNWNEDKFCD